MRYHGLCFVLSSIAVLLIGCTRYTVIHQQTERDANHIVRLLLDHGISADKTRDEKAKDLRFDVQVPQETKHDALTLLEHYKLPNPEATDSQDLIDGNGLIPTPEQQRLRQIVALRGDIINALRDLPHVVDVKVVASIPGDQPLPSDPTVEEPRPQVSIILVYQPDSRGNAPLTTEEIQRFAHAAASGIKPPEVDVKLIPMEFGAEPPSDRRPSIDSALCRKEQVVGMMVCEGARSDVVRLILGVLTISGVLAAMAMIAVLRALRYRKDLTRLTAEFQRHSDERGR